MRIGRFQPCNGPGVCSIASEVGQGSSPKEAVTKMSLVGVGGCIAIHCIMLACWEGNSMSCHHGEGKAQ